MTETEKQVGSPVEQDWKRLVHDLRHEILQQTCELANAQRKIFDNAGVMGMGKKAK